VLFLRLLLYQLPVVFLLLEDLHVVQLYLEVVHLEDHVVDLVEDLVEVVLVAEDLVVENLVKKIVVNLAEKVKNVNVRKRNVVELNSLVFVLMDPVFKLGDLVLRLLHPFLLFLV
jgi:hypothetical protein